MTSITDAAMCCIETSHLLTVFFLLLAIALFYKWSVSSRLDIPGPFPWPLIGNALSMGDETHLTLQKMKNRYGPVFLMKLGSIDVVVLNTHATIREALLKNRKALSGRPNFQSFANISGGDGIVFNDVTTQGEEWRRVKSFLARNLHRYMRDGDSQRRLMLNIHAEANELLRRLIGLSEDSADRSVDPGPMIHLLVANIACACVFGRRYDYDDKEFTTLISMNSEFGSFVGANNRSDTMPWLKKLSIVLPYFQNKWNTFKSLNLRMTNWVLARTKNHQKLKTESHDLYETLTKSWGRMQDNTEMLNDDRIVALLTDVFGATQDTTGSLMKWIIAYLLNYPEYQTEIQEEIEEQLEHKDYLEMDDVKHMVMLNAFIHEVCRHSSFVCTTIPHSTLDDVTIDNHHLPKGTLVFINQYAANRDPLEWDEPEEFLPSRFIEISPDHEQQRRINKKQTDKYLIFSLGERKCPGDQLAWTFVTHLLVTILSIATFQSPPNGPIPSLDPVYSLTMVPPPYRVKIRVHNEDRFERLRQLGRESLLQNHTSSPLPSSSESTQLRHPVVTSSSVAVDEAISVNMLKTMDSIYKPPIELL